MKFGKLMGFVAVSSFAASMAMAGTSSMDMAKMFEKECQGCHGPIHQGGVGSDLRPKALKKKNHEMLAETILNGRENTAMPAWKEKFSINHATIAAASSLENFSFHAGIAVFSRPLRIVSASISWFFFLSALGRKSEPTPPWWIGP